VTKNEELTRVAAAAFTLGFIFGKKALIAHLREQNRLVREYNTCHGNAIKRLSEALDQKMHSDELDKLFKDELDFLKMIHPFKS